MASPSLSLRDCLRSAVTGMWRHPADVLRAFWPVYLLAIPYWLLDGMLWKIATGLFLSLATVPCACAWHRRIIADEPATLALGRPEWNFVKVEMSILVLSAAALFLSIMVGVFAATILPHWSTPLFFMVPGFVATCWLVSPMLLGLPAAALGHHRSSAQLDTAAAPQRVKLTVLTMLIPTVHGMAQQLVGLTGSAASVGNLVLDLLCWPLGIGILSLAYVRLGIGDMETETAPS